MKQNKLLIILTTALVISILLNIILFVKTNSLSNDSNKNNEYNLAGIYQTQYFNNYDHSMTITLKLYEDGNCKISHYATEYSDNEDDCTWISNNNIIELTNGTNTKKRIDVLTSGNLLYENHELKKIG